MSLSAEWIDRAVSEKRAVPQKLLDYGVNNEVMRRICVDICFDLRRIQKCIRIRVADIDHREFRSKPRTIVPVPEESEPLISIGNLIASSLHIANVQYKIITGTQGLHPKICGFACFSLINGHFEPILLQQVHIFLKYPGGIAVIP